MSAPQPVPMTLLQVQYITNGEKVYKVLVPKDMEEQNESDASKSAEPIICQVQPTSEFKSLCTVESTENPSITSFTDLSSKFKSVKSLVKFPVQSLLEKEKQQTLFQKVVSSETVDNTCLPAPIKQEKDTDDFKFPSSCTEDKIGSLLTASKDNYGMTVSVSQKSVDSEKFNYSNSPASSQRRVTSNSKAQNTCTENTLTASKANYSRKVSVSQKDASAERTNYSNSPASSQLQVTTNSDAQNTRDNLKFQMCGLSEKKFSSGVVTDITQDNSEFSRKPTIQTQQRTVVNYGANTNSQKIKLMEKKCEILEQQLEELNKKFKVDRHSKTLINSTTAATTTTTTTATTTPTTTPIQRPLILKRGNLAQSHLISQPARVKTTMSWKPKLHGSSLSPVQNPTETHKNGILPVTSKPPGDNSEVQILTTGDSSTASSGKEISVNDQPINLECSEQLPLSPKANTNQQEQCTIVGYCDPHPQCEKEVSVLQHALTIPSKSTDLQVTKIHNAPLNLQSSNTPVFRKLNRQPCAATNHTCYTNTGQKQTSVLATSASFKKAISSLAEPASQTINGSNLMPASYGILMNQTNKTHYVESSRGSVVKHVASLPQTQISRTSNLPGNVLPQPAISHIPVWPAPLHQNTRYNVSRIMNPKGNMSPIYGSAHNLIKISVKPPMFDEVSPSIKEVPGTQGENVARIPAPLASLVPVSRQDFVFLPDTEIKNVCSQNKKNSDEPVCVLSSVWSMAPSEPHLAPSQPSLQKPASEKPQVNLVFSKNANSVTENFSAPVVTCEKQSTQTYLSKPDLLAVALKDIISELEDFPDKDVTSNITPTECPEDKQTSNNSTAVVEMITNNVQEYFRREKMTAIVKEKVTTEYSNSLSANKVNVVTNEEKNLTKMTEMVPPTKSLNSLNEETKLTSGGIKQHDTEKSHKVMDPVVTSVTSNKRLNSSVTKVKDSSVSQKTHQKILNTLPVGVQMRQLNFSESGNTGHQHYYPPCSPVLLPHSSITKKVKDAPSHHMILKMQRRMREKVKTKTSPEINRSDRHEKYLENTVSDKTQEVGKSMPILFFEKPLNAEDIANKNKPVIKNDKSNNKISKKSSEEKCASRVTNPEEAKEWVKSFWQTIGIPTTETGGTPIQKTTDGTQICPFPNWNPSSTSPEVNAVSSVSQVEQPASNSQNKTEVNEAGPLTVFRAQKFKLDQVQSSQQEVPIPHLETRQSQCINSTTVSENAREGIQKHNVHQEVSKSCSKTKPNVIANPSVLSLSPGLCTSTIGEENVSKAKERTKKLVPGSEKKEIHPRKLAKENTSSFFQVSSSVISDLKCTLNAVQRTQQEVPKASSEIQPINNHTVSENAPDEIDKHNVKQDVQISFSEIQPYKLGNKSATTLSQTPTCSVPIFRKCILKTNFKSAQENKTEVKISAIEKETAFNFKQQNEVPDKPKVDCLTSSSKEKLKTMHKSVERKKKQLIPITEAGKISESKDNLHKDANEKTHKDDTSVESRVQKISELKEKCHFSNINQIPLKSCSKNRVAYSSKYSTAGEIFLSNKARKPNMLKTVSPSMPKTVCLSDDSSTESSDSVTENEDQRKQAKESDKIKMDNQIVSRKLIQCKETKPDKIIKEIRSASFVKKSVATSTTSSDLSKVCQVLVVNTSSPAENKSVDIQSNVSSVDTKLKSKSLPCPKVTSKRTKDAKNLKSFMNKEKEHKKSSKQELLKMKVKHASLNKDKPTAHAQKAINSNTASGGAGHKDIKESTDVSLHKNAKLIVNQLSVKKTLTSIETDSTESDSSSDENYLPSETESEESSSSSSEAENEAFGMLKMLTVKKMQGLVSPSETDVCSSEEGISKHKTVKEACLKALKPKTQAVVKPKTMKRAGSGVLDPYLSLIIKPCSVRLQILSPSFIEMHLNRQKAQKPESKKEMVPNEMSVLQSVIKSFLKKEQKKFAKKRKKRMKQKMSEVLSTFLETMGEMCQKENAKNFNHKRSKDSKKHKLSISNSDKLMKRKRSISKSASPVSVDNLGEPSHKKNRTQDKELSNVSLEEKYADLMKRFEETNKLLDLYKKQNY